MIVSGKAEMANSIWIDTPPVIVVVIKREVGAGWSLSLGREGEGLQQDLSALGTTLGPAMYVRWLWVGTGESFWNWTVQSNFKVGG